MFSRATAALLMCTAVAYGHGGGTDSRGGHVNRKTGVYHTHGGGSSSSSSSSSSYSSYGTYSSTKSEARTEGRTSYRSTAPSESRSGYRAVSNEDYEQDMARLKAEAELAKARAEADRQEAERLKAELAIKQKAEEAAAAEAAKIQEALDREEAAARKLRTAKMLGNNPQAQLKRYKEIVDDYSETKAAVEAAELLTKLRKKLDAE